MNFFISFRFLFFTTCILICNFQFLISVDPYKSGKRAKKIKKGRHKFKLGSASRKVIKIESPVQAVPHRSDMEKKSIVPKEIVEKEKVPGFSLFSKNFKKNEDLRLKNLSRNEEIIEKLTGGKEELEKAYKNMLEIVQKNKEEIKKIVESEDEELLARKKMLLTYNKSHEKNLEILKKNIEIFKKRIESAKREVEVLKEGELIESKFPDAQQKILKELKKGFMRHKKGAAASMLTGGLALGYIGAFGTLVSGGGALAGGLAAQVDFDQQLDREEDNFQLGSMVQENPLFYQEDDDLSDKNNSLLSDEGSDVEVYQDSELKLKFLERAKDNWLLQNKKGENCE